MSATFTMPPAKATLVDMPVSNFGSRCRFIVYTKELESTIDVVTPMEFGGLKTPEYLAVNPQGKMPALITEEGDCFGESDVIARYLIERFAEQGPSFSGSLKDNTLANSLARQHDIYVGPIMGFVKQAALNNSSYNCTCVSTKALHAALHSIDMTNRLPH
eukprot:8121-Heterococcus_DN1.PRE.1